MPYAILLLLIAFQPSQTPQLIENQRLYVLVRDTDVKFELKFSVEQVSKLRGRYIEAAKRHSDRIKALQEPRLAEDARASFELMRVDYQKSVEEILMPDQLRRLVEIQIQVNGVHSFLTPSIEAALGLDEQQKSKCRKLVRELEANLRQSTLDARAELRKPELNVRQAAPPEWENRYRTEMARQWERSFRKAYAILTPEQKLNWKRLAGEPFAGAKEGIYRQAAMERPRGMR